MMEESLAEKKKKKKHVRIVYKLRTFEAKRAPMALSSRCFVSFMLVSREHACPVKKQNAKPTSTKL